MGTVIVGLIYLILWWANLGWAITSWTVTILTGGTMGIIMFLNVWLVIWPNQKIVIGSAVTVAGGGQADPKAAPAGRRAGLASRTNTVFSIPLLFFMGAASHYSMFSNPTTGGIWAWLIITGIVIVLIEINALVGTTGATKKPLDSAGRHHVWFRAVADRGDHHQDHLELAGCGKSLRSLLPLSYLPPARGRRLREEANFYAGCYSHRATSRSLHPFFAPC